MVRAAIAFLALTLLSSAAQAERRIAFVVGIDKYDNLGPQQQLQRAVSDARAVSAALSSVGFEVTAPENVGRGAFNAEWQKFLDKLQPGDTAAIYFSGHGVEIEGLNFLLPRDVPNISFGRQEQLKRESLSVSEMLLDLRKRKPQVTLVILDACRDNPLVPPEQRSLSLGKGLARMDAPAGTFIMYSAGAGEVALDRLPGNDPDKTNSVYTRKLLPLMKTAGLPLHELARQLRREVHDLATGGASPAAAGLLRWLDRQVLFGRLRGWGESSQSRKALHRHPLVIEARKRTPRNNKPRRNTSNAQ